MSSDRRKLYREIASRIALFKQTRYVRRDFLTTHRKPSNSVLN